MLCSSRALAPLDLYVESNTTWPFEAAVDLHLFYTLVLSRVGLHKVALCRREVVQQQKNCKGGTNKDSWIGRMFGKRASEPKIRPRGGNHSRRVSGEERRSSHLMQVARAGRVDHLRSREVLFKEVVDLIW